MKQTKCTILSLLFILFCQAGKGQHAMNMGMQNHSGIYIKMMDAMMVNMAKAPHGKTVASDFLYQMIPHHQGAIAMAAYEIAHGKDPLMVQLAKSIYQEQNSEVVQMKLWLGQKFPEGDIIKRNYRAEINSTMDAMMTHMPAHNKTMDIDHVFARIMIPHHQAAIDMARVLLKYSTNKIARNYGMQLIVAEQLEIEQMTQFLK